MHRTFFGRALRGIAAAFDFDAAMNRRVEVVCK